MVPFGRGFPIAVDVFREEQVLYQPTELLTLKSIPTTEPK